MKFRTLVILAAGAVLASCGSDSPTASGSQPRTVAASDYTTTSSGLQYFDFVVGTGVQPASGDVITVHYEGWLTDGTKFDSSRDRNDPLSVEIGIGRVIAGWDEGVINMRVGGQRQLRIPASLGYGAGGTGSIPGNATLIFEVELLNVQGG